MWPNIGKLNQITSGEIKLRNHQQIATTLLLTVLLVSNLNSSQLKAESNRGGFMVIWKA